MLSFRRVQELYHSYMVLDHNPDITATDYGYNMMMHKHVPYLAVFQNRSRDGISEYYYDITGYTSLKDLSHRKLNEKMIDRLVNGLCGVMESMEEYLLDCDDMVIDLESVFYGENGQFRFLYYPGYQKDFVNQLKILAEQILTAIDYTSDGCVKKAYKLYHLACDESNALKRLKSFFFGEETAKENEEQPKTVAALPCKDDEKSLPMVSEPETKPTKTLPVWMWPLLVLENVLICFVAFMVMHLWLFEDYMVSGICTLGIGMILVVTEVLVVRNKYMDAQKDFWQPEDYIDMDGVGGWNENTDIYLNSVDKARWPDIEITHFPAIIGKDSKDRACCIGLPIISRKHARLDKKKDGVYITDLSSSNGTFVNGEMIQPGKRVRLNPKDSVIFADVEFIFESTAMK